MSTTDDQTPAQPDDQTPDPADDSQDTPGKRAARVARQEAVTRAEQAEARVATFQRREIARLAGGILAEGADVLETTLGGSELAALLDADGVPDPELVTAAATTMAEKRPGLAVVRRTRIGSPDGGAREPLPRTRGWADVIRAGR